MGHAHIVMFPGIQVGQTVDPDQTAPFLAFDHIILLLIHIIKILG